MSSFGLRVSVEGAPGYFDASVHVARKAVPQGKVDRAMGDVHPGGNPHFLLDPRQVQRIATALGAHLGKLDPPRADAYHRNAARFVQRLGEVAAAQAARFEALPAVKRRVVSYHASMVDHGR